MNKRYFYKFLLAFFLCLTYISILHVQSTEATAWYNVSWNYRKAITIDHTKVGTVNNTDLSYFPVLVSITDVDLKNNALSNGNDIVFTSSDGTTKLNHEIEKYNSSTGELEAWVQVPVLSHSSDTTIYLYYGNSSATNQQSVAATWNDGGTSNYLSVYHVPNGSTLSGTDSTGSFNLTNSSATASAGVIDGSANLNGTSAYLYNDAFSTAASALTFSAWAKLTNHTVALYTIADLGWQFATLHISQFNAFWEIGGVTNCQKSISNVQDQWHLYTGTFDQSGGVFTLYQDGVSIGSCAVSSTASFPGHSTLTIGAISKGGGGQFFGGDLDEVEFSKVARSADWIKTEYNNQSAASTFYTVSSAQTPISAPTISSFTATPAAVSAGGSSTLSWSLTGTVDSVTINPGSFTSTASTGSTVVSPSTTTTYTISASNAGGTTTQDVVVTVDTSAPTAPSNLSIATTTPTSIALSWTKSTDNVAVTGYNIYRNGTKINTVVPGTYINSAINSNSYDYYVDTGLSPGTQYSYTLEAIDGQNNTSSQSSSILGTTEDKVIPSTPQWNMGFYRSVDAAIPISSIYWTGLTHVVHFAAVPLADGSLEISGSHIDTTATDLIAAAHAHGTKVLLGLSSENTDLADAIGNHETVLINNITNLVTTYGYDGVDIDWEPVSDFTKLGTLLSDLRSALGAKLLTGDAYVQDQVNWSAYQSYLDKVNVMTYGTVGAGSGAVWHNDALDRPNNAFLASIELYRSRWTTAGFPSSKINIGLPFFAFIVQGGCQTVGCSDGTYAPLQTWTTTPSFFEDDNAIRNYNLTTGNPDWHWDITAHNPYLSINQSGSVNDKFVTFDNAQSFIDKINYVQAQGLGGTFFWNVGMDYTSSGTTPAEQFPLSAAMAIAYTSGSDTTAPAVSFTSPTTGATISGSSVPIVATASDTDSSIASVQFKLDTINISSADTTAPYAISWDSNAASDGVHTLYAIATDIYGNSATASISITVHNHQTSSSHIIGGSVNHPIQSIESPTVPIASIPTTNIYLFTHNLSLHMNHPDVRELQKYLNAHGFVIATSGAGSPGNETTYFGSLTYAALIKFQNAYAASILAPHGLTKGTGYFGPSTRAYIRENSN